MLSDANLEILFTKARSHKSWLNKEVTEDQIDQIYNLLKFAPTSGNCCPARFTFIKSDEAKERLMPTLDKGNIDKSMKAPYVVIISYDTEFYESLSILSPHNDATAGFIGKENKIKDKQEVISKIHQKYTGKKSLAELEIGDLIRFQKSIYKNLLTELENLKTEIKSA